MLPLFYSQILAVQLLQANKIYSNMKENSSSLKSLLYQVYCNNYYRLLAQPISHLLSIKATLFCILFGLSWILWFLCTFRNHPHSSHHDSAFNASQPANPASHAGVWALPCRPPTGRCRASRADRLHEGKYRVEWCADRLHEKEYYTAFL